MQKKSTQPRGSIGPLVLIGLGLLLLLAVAVLLLVRPAGNNANTSTSSAPKNLERVSLEDSKAAFDAREAVFLDVRDAESYNAGHIPGAVNIPISMLESRASSLDPNQWIITYCT